MILSLLGSMAFAAGLHAGIPVDGLPTLGPAEFPSPEAGWTAPVLDPQGRPRGVVRVRVSPDEVGAKTWMVEAARGVQAPLSPLLGLGDEALGGAGVVVARDGNVAVYVAVAEGSARPTAQLLLSAIVDTPAAWPSPPTVRADGGLWRVEAPGAVHVDALGGRRPLGEPWAFRELPEELVAWDAWGRAAVWRP